jgi:hypothetical protein
MAEWKSAKQVRGVRRMYDREQEDVQGIHG